MTESSDGREPPGCTRGHRAAAHRVPEPAGRRAGSGQLGSGQRDRRRLARRRLDGGHLVRELSAGAPGALGPPPRDERVQRRAQRALARIRRRLHPRARDGVSDLAWPLGGSGYRCSRSATAPTRTCSSRGRSRGWRDRCSSRGCADSTATPRIIFCGTEQQKRWLAGRDGARPHRGQSERREQRRSSGPTCPEPGPARGIRRCSSGSSPRGRASRCSSRRASPSRGRQAWSWCSSATGVATRRSRPLWRRPSGDVVYLGRLPYEELPGVVVRTASPRLRRSSRTSAAPGVLGAEALRVDVVRRAGDRLGLPGCRRRDPALRVRSCRPARRRRGARGRRADAGGDPTRRARWAARPGTRSSASARGRRARSAAGRDGARSCCGLMTRRTRRSGARRPALAGHALFHDSTCRRKMAHRLVRPR